MEKTVKIFPHDGDTANDEIFLYGGNVGISSHPGGAVTHGHTGPVWDSHRVSVTIHSLTPKKEALVFLVSLFPVSLLGYSGFYRYREGSWLNLSLFVFVSFSPFCDIIVFFTASSRIVSYRTYAIESYELFLHVWIAHPVEAKETSGTKSARRR